MMNNRQIGEWTWFRREFQPFVRVQLGSVAALLGATVLSLVDPLIIKWLVDSGLQQRRWTPILLAIAAFCVVYLARMGLLHFGSLWTARVVQQVMIRIRRRVLRRLQSLDAPFYDRHRVGDLVHRLEQDVEQLGQVGGDVLPTLARIILSVSVTLVIMFVLNWRLSCAVLPFIPVLLYLRGHFRTLLERTAETSREAIGVRTSFLNECLGASIQVQMLGAEPFFHRKYTRHVLEASRASLMQRRTELLYFAGSLTIMTLSTAAVLLAGAYEVMQGALTLGGYIAFYSYLMRLLDPLSGAVDMHARLKRASSSIRRIVELEGLEPVVADSENQRSFADSDVQEIACRNLTFTYAEGQSVLQGINLHIARGQKIALVGQSGSGKSTLAKLLVRMYEPESGGVFLGGMDVRGLRLRSVRELISLVPPNPVLFAGTIRENVLLGERVPGGELERLSRIACFDSVVEKFSSRWDHMLGSAGAGLSDGEKQRLGLLRALVRDRSMLILDEATGALDPVVEAEVLSRLDDYTREKFLLMITHRPSTAAWAERVLVVRDGQLVEVSCPEEFATNASALGRLVWGPMQDHPTLVRH